MIFSGFNQLMPIMRIFLLVIFVLANSTNLSANSKEDLIRLINKEFEEADGVWVYESKTKSITQYKGGSKEKNDLKVYRKSTSFKKLKINEVIFIKKSLLKTTWNHLSGNENRVFYDGRVWEVDYIEVIKYLEEIKKSHLKSNLLKSKSKQ